MCRRELTRRGVLEGNRGIGVHTVGTFSCLTLYIYIYSICVYRVYFQEFYICLNKMYNVIRHLTKCKFYM